MKPPLILALDSGTRMGWAAGQAGGHPTSGSERVPLADLIGWLQEWFSKQKPDLVVVEAPLALKVYAKLGTSEQSVYLQLQQHGIIAGMSGLWRVRHQEIEVRRIRQHFTGTARHGGRAESKRAVVARCHQLRYLPRDCADDDRADACALWDFASSCLARKPPKELVLFAA